MVVIGVMIVTFILIHLEPGSVARSILGIRATSDRIAIFNATYGLNQPLYKQLVDYVEQVARGNLGTSYYLQQPVSALFAQRLPRDLLLLGSSTAAALLDLRCRWASTRRYGAAGSWTTCWAQRRSRCTACRTFCFAMMLVAMFAVQTHVFLPEAPQAPRSARCWLSPGRWCCRC